MTSVISGKALWGVVCGSTVLPSDEIVIEELKDATSHLKEGLLMLKPWSEEGHKKWSSSTKLKENQKKFVYKLGKLLDLSSDQSWELFQLFLQHEYRGSTNQLASAGNNIREETELLHQTWSFYLSDPLHLLSCLRHLLTFDMSHPYHSLFTKYIKEDLDPDHGLGSSLIRQLEMVSGFSNSAPGGAPAKRRHNPPLSSSNAPPRALYNWVGTQLGAIKHLLATLVVYYGSPDKQFSPEILQKLLKMAQGGGLSQLCIESIDGGNTVEIPKALIEAIDALHSFLLVLLLLKDEEPRSQSFNDPKWITKFDQIINTLGSRSWHHPTLLAWSVLLAKKASASTDSADKCHGQYKKLAERAIKGKVFEYLQKALNNPAIETDKLLLRVTSSMLFALICNVGTYLDVNSTGCMPQLLSLAHQCISEEPPAEMFWSEEDGMIDLLLPHAFEQYPQNPEPLLSLCQKLASANQNSCTKVVELLSDLPSFTWILSEMDTVSIRGGQAISESVLEPIPGFQIPVRTAGTLVGTPTSVIWHYHHSGWQFIQAVLKIFEVQICNGVTINDWLLSTTIQSLKLLTAVISAVPSHLPAMVHLRKDAMALLLRVSQISKPDYWLVAALLEFFAEVSKQEAKSVWMDLESCPLLPSLQIQGQGNKKWRGEGLLGYRAGNARALICLHEKALGKYSIFRSICQLVSSSLKAKVCNSSIRGGVVFIVREVLPEVLGWTMASSLEQVNVLLSCLTMLHHALEYKSDLELRAMVVGDLVSGCGKSTLRSLIEHGARMEAVMNQPSSLVQWPHSSHTRNMAQIAKSALSILHKLVSLYNENETVGPKNGLNGLLQGNNEAIGSSLLTTTGVSKATSCHLALTVARYCHNRLDPQLPYLSLQTLTSLAEKVDVPLVACLGAEAEGIKDSLLTRLDSSTDDLRIKVSLIRLLKVSTVHQPGLLRLFLTPLPPLLDPLMMLLRSHYEIKAESDNELISALLELLAALWCGNYATAMAHLRDNEEFWEAISHPLHTAPTSTTSISLISYTIKLISYEYFVSQVKAAKGLQKGMDKFVDPINGKLSVWSKFILDISCQKLPKDSENTVQSKKLLLNCWRDFLVVINKRCKNLFSPKQLADLAEHVLDQLIIVYDNIEDNEDFRHFILCELHLSLVNNCGKEIGDLHYINKLSNLLSKIRVSVMKISPKSQIVIYSAILKCLILVGSSNLSADCATILLESSLHLVAQHCNLTRGGKSVSHCSSPAVLATITQLVHQCFVSLPASIINMHLVNSSLMPELATIATFSVNQGNVEVVENILSLFIHIAKSTDSPSHLTTQSLAETISLSLVNEHNENLISELIWTVIATLNKEGVLGIEGAVSIVAVHLESLVGALLSPHYHPSLALAASVLIANLVPHSHIWRVNNQYCYSKLISAIGSCVHITTHLLSLPTALEKEMGFSLNKQNDMNANKSKSLSVSVGNLSSNTLNLINKLLQILSASLRALRCLGPDLTDLLCHQGLDLSMWLPPVIDSSFRRISSDHPETNPNLATLSAILDLHHTYSPKEGRGTSPNRAGSPSQYPHLSILSQCAEEALYLLIAQTGLVLISGEVGGREAREIRNFLADETNSFFSHWLGRKTVQSPLLPPAKDQSQSFVSPIPDFHYLKLAKHIVESLYRAKFL